MATSSFSFIASWRRPFSSTYLRSAGGYLGLKVAIFSLAGFAGQYLLTHSLQQKDYGLIVWAGTIIAMLGPFGLPGISTSITGAVAKGFGGNFIRGTWYEILGGTLGGVVLLGIAVYHYFWSGDPQKAMIFTVAGVLGPGLWLDTHQCYWNGQKNFRAIFWWSVPLRLVQLAATAGVLLISANPVVVFAVQNAIQVIANIGTAVGLIKFGKIRKEFSQEYWSFGNYSTVLYFIGIVSVYFDKLAIGAFSSLQTLAVFAVGELLYTYFYKTPAGVLSQIFLPRQAEMDLREAARWTLSKQKVIIPAVALMVAILGVSVPVLYPLVFSQKYADSVFYAELFLVCILLGAPTLLSGSFLKAHARKQETKVGWLIMLISPLVSVPVMGWLFGIAGVALARGVTNAVLSVYYLYVLKRLQKA